MKTLLLSLFTLVCSASFSQSWQDVGGGTNNSSHGMLTYNGKLVNLGSYTNPCQRVSTWDGTTWECLGGGVGIVGRAGVVWDGKLVVVGDFWNNFQPCVGCNGVAVWDGSTWSALDQGFNNDVLTCTVFNGELIIGGDFTQANGVPCSRVVRWNELSSTFESLGTAASFGNDVRCMTEYDGDLWVGGDFNNVDGCSACDGLVKWDDVGSVWTGGNSGVDLVGGVNESVRVLYVNPNDGNLYMGGEFPELIDGNVGTQDFNMAGIAMYDGSDWTSLGTGLNEYCRAIHEYNGYLIAGGYFTTAGGVSANKIAKWNSLTGTWTPMGLGFDASGIDEYVKSATVWNGIFFAGGAYTQAEGAPMNYIAQWYEPLTSPPTAGINPSSNGACVGGCIDFSDNSIDNPTSWTWAFPGATVTSSTAEDPGSICYASAGTYTVQLEACNTNGCDITTTDITIIDAPTVTVTDQSICDGSSATIPATPSTGGGTYLWSPGLETTSSITVNPSSTTTYSVQYTLNGCASASEDVTITVNTVPTVSVNNATICDGDNATLIGTPSTSGGTYDWFTTGETTIAISVSPSTTSIYDLVYTLNGCPSMTATGVVTVNPTFSTSESMSVCSGTTVTYPDGSTEVITAPTSHINNLVAVNTCDSIVTTNVTLSASFVSSESVTACEGASYTYPDGNSETITASTSHINNLTSTLGCDSTVTTNLTMISSFTGGESVSICDGDNITYPDGNTETITASTSHVNNLNSIDGCDSTVTTNVTMVAGYATSESVSVCDGAIHTYPDGSSETITTSTSHVSSLSSTLGCDSLVTTNVTMVSDFATSESVSVCNGASYTYPDGSSETITASTSHVSALSSTIGCDSVVTTNVTMASSFTTSETIAVCDGDSYTYPDGTVSANVTTNESHVSILVANGGCDSIVTTNVTVDALPDNTTTLTGNTLNSNQLGATYQWLDCDDGNSPINGETNQSFVPSINGSYAVQVTLNGCTSTSACTIINTIGFGEQDLSYSIYPNPVSTVLRIETKDNIEGLTYKIYDSRGRLVQEGLLENQLEIDVSLLDKGVYVLKLASSAQLRFVKG